MTNIADILDTDLLAQMTKEGMVRIGAHPTQPLFIANYTPAAQYSRTWNEVTSQCRGLIYDHDGEIVARPFSKFHNWDESQVTIPSGPMMVSPKMDGSLGILYMTDFGLRIASRGSFSSEQAIMGSRMFERDCTEHFLPIEGKTYLFEIIYPQNRIVVNYGDFEGLVLLDVIDNETGRRDQEAFDIAGWEHKVEMNLRPSFTDALTHEIPDDEEGFVLYFPYHDARLKMKGATYVALHRVITNTNAQTIWEYLSENKPFEPLLENVPDEFYDWVAQTKADLIADYVTIFALANEHYNQIRHLHMDRKAFAAEAKKRPYPHLLFRMFDGREMNTDIWKLVKPEYEKPYWSGTEAVAAEVA